MKNPILAAMAAAAGGALLFLTPAALAQGSLTPSGAPAPSMVTLQQIQPRTPVSGITVITKPGAYYLTTNIAIGPGSYLNFGVYVETNNVSLDLNGFAITSTATSPVGYGIYLAGCSNVQIANGSISGTVIYNGTSFTGGGFSYGIYTYGNAANIRVSHVIVSGVYDDGINLGVFNSSAVESCNVNVAGGSGIVADVVANCTAQNCGYSAINAYSAINCFGLATSGGFAGIAAQQAQNCFGFCLGTNGEFGVTATDVQNCQGTGANCGIEAITVAHSYGYCGTGGTGIFAEYSGVGCYGSSYSGSGIDAGLIFLSYGICETASEAGLTATLANSCMAYGNPSYTVSYKYNMP